MTSQSKWQYQNPASNHPPTSTPPQPGTTTRISVPAGTDIWRPSLSKDTFSAPYLYTTLPISSFRSVRTTVSAPWKTKFDQGGLLLVFSARGSESESGQAAEQWIKAGIEFFEGAPQLGVVATDRMSDWSLSPLASASAFASEGGGSGSASGEGNPSATIEIEPKEGSAWVYVVDEGTGQRRALREVSWAFPDDREGELRIGVYAAKPTPDEGDAGRELVVEFTGLEIETDRGKLL